MTDNASSEAKNQKLTTAGVFSRAAATYGQVGPPFFAHFGSRLVELAEVSPRSVVLDIASGRGASLFPAAERIGLTGKAVGIDLAEGMVRLLATEVRRRGLHKVDIQVMDAEHLLFHDETFDYVLCGFCLFFFPNPQRALSEVLRVLKPKGRLASSTWGKTPDQWQWLDKLIESYLPDPSPSSEPPEAPAPDFETPVGMLTLMQQAGFAAIKTVAESETFTYASEEEWWTTQWSHGMRAALEKIETTLGAEGLGRFKASAFDTIQGLKTSAGICQPFPVLYTLANKP